jgi:enamine deaminase RidA (YjgF/YER057c/UK114 family)
MNLEVLQPPGWPRPLGYANGIAASGRLVFVAGQVGWNERSQFDSDRLADQVRQALKNIVAVVAAAGGRPEHVVRLTWFIASAAEYHANVRDIGAAYREVFGKHFPAMSVLQVAGFVEAGAKVEIEATAVI